jgi:hypothetical protein
MSARQCLVLLSCGWLQAKAALLETIRLATRRAAVCQSSHQPNPNACRVLCLRSTRPQVLDVLGIQHSGSGMLPEAAAPAFVTRAGYKVGACNSQIEC